MSKIAIISGRYPNTTFDSVTNHKVYADKFGYHYIHCNWPTNEKNRYMNKICFIQAYFDLFDYIIWLDDDAFFWDFEKDIMDFAPKNEHFLSICKSPNFKNLKTYFSSGQFIIKTNDRAKEFLDSVLTLEMEIVKKWWNHDLGYFTNGDQDLMTYLALSDNRFSNKLSLYNYKYFNSRVENLISEDVHIPLILHFTGTVDVKIRNYAWVQQEYRLHSSLISDKYLANYNIFRKKNE
ncbi:MAG: hypothetical protein ABJ033_13270, partial [Nonlabens ulvanivorans]